MLVRILIKRQLQILSKLIWLLMQIYKVATSNLPVMAASFELLCDNDCMNTADINYSFKRHQQASGRMANLWSLLSDSLPYWCNFWILLKSFTWGSELHLHLLKFMYWHSCNQILCEEFCNHWWTWVCLTKSLSIDSHVMGVDTPHNKSIANRVQVSYNTPRGRIFNSSSSSFQTILSRDIIHNGDYNQRNLSYHFSHQQSHLTLI